MLRSLNLALHLALFKDDSIVSSEKDDAVVKNI